MITGAPPGISDDFVKKILEAIKAKDKTIFLSLSKINSKE